MRTVAVHALPLAPGAELDNVMPWRALPKEGDAVTVVRLDGSRERWRGTVTGVDEERRTYSVVIEGAKSASSS